MTAPTTHSALIWWSREHVVLGLFDALETTDPAWLPGAIASSEGWSLVCTFDVSPAQQRSPSRARVRFMMAEAPHEALLVDGQLRLFERATGKFAEVEILD